MAYPDLWRAGRDPDTQEVPIREEILPFSPNGNLQYASHPMIHFDLDVRNGKRKVMERIGMWRKMKNHLPDIAKSI